MKYKLIDVASVIRSKNSGPYELTFDVIFKDFDMYNKVKAAKAIDEKAFCRLYNILSNSSTSTLPRRSR